MIFHRMSSVFLYKKAEVFLLPFFFARKQLPFSQHRLSRGTQTARAVHPFRAAPFLHRLTGARELPQAGSPLTGGKFFAEPQQGVALCGARERRGTRRGGKKEGQPAVFLPL